MSKSSVNPRKAARDGSPLHQVAALPFRRGPDGEVEILVLTSRQTRRFIIPKGWSTGAKKVWKAAEVEAREEGGVRGKISHRPVGRYCYWKRFAKHFGLIEVEVYPMEVDKELKRWPEKSQRIRRWLPADDAALLVDEPQLVSLIREFAL
jgi:hypothetical protein